MNKKHLDRVDIVEDGKLDLFQLNNALNDMREGLNSLQDILQDVLEQTKKTNGRVAELEKWRVATEKAKAFAEGVRSGGIAVIGAVVTAASTVGVFLAKLLWEA